MRAFSLVVGAGLGLASAAVPGDLVPSLPNFTGEKFPTIYSGYLNIPGGKHLHYMLSLATAADPATAPLVFWTNGGPGCSSLEGFFNEGGILSLSADGSSLTVNPYSWNNITNGLYIEQPAGVGFSYADTFDGLVHNDTSTAQDNLQAMLAFYASYPEYQANDLYLSGESYAGIYVPMMASAVVDYNRQQPTKPLKLKGILVGNGCLGTEVGVCGDDFSANGLNIDQWRGHGLISSSAYAQVQQYCDWSNPTSACQKALNQASDMIGPISIYDIYAPECINSQSAADNGFARLASLDELDAAAEQIRSGQVLSEPLQHYNKVPLTASRRRMFEMMGYGSGTPGPAACIDAGGLPTYLNTPEVRQALHVVDSAKYVWTICSGNLSYTPTMPDERVQIYPNIIASGARVLIYNGEADACVPFEDNERWTESMNYRVVKSWHPWMVNDANVGGYASVYAPSNSSLPDTRGQFQFVTVRGAGHMVPETQPEAAWVMFKKFLDGVMF